MITVKLYGLLRLDTGIREVQLEADTVNDVLVYLQGQGVGRQALNGCLILCNGKPAKKRSKLQPGDVVQLLPPVAGG